MNSIPAGDHDISRVGRDARGSPISPRPSVAVGFGSPADDTGVTRLDLNDILVRHPPATFLMRVAGNAMHEAGIDEGDLVLVDRALTPANGHVVIAVVEDDFVCRRFAKHGGELRLQAADTSIADIVAREGEEFQVWGVVTSAIKSMPV